MDYTTENTQVIKFHSFYGFNDTLGVENYVYWAYEWNMRSEESNDLRNSIYWIKLMLYMPF